MQVAGPEVSNLAALARTWRSVTGRQAALLRLPLPGRLGRGLRAGSLTTSAAEVVGTITFADWLAASRDQH
jgi:hypothetical protein